MSNYTANQAREDEAGERTEKAARIKTLYALAVYLTSSEGPCREYTAQSFSEEGYRPSVDLCADDGRRIHLTVNSYDPHPRLNVSGAYPHATLIPRHFPPTERTRITVDFAKPPTAIGKDIGRRFLNQYERDYAEGKRQATADDLAQMLLTTIGQRLATRCCTRLDERELSQGRLVLSAYRPEWLKISSYDGQRFKLEADVLGEVTLNALLDVLKPHKDHGASQEEP